MPSEAAGKHYDVIIIGTGAGGGTLAHALAPSGKRVLLLERGGYLKRERENWSSKAVFLEARYKAKEAWLDRAGKEFHPGIHYCVGGNTKVYGAALLRFRASDFGEVRHHGGLSPAWPLDYQDFEPYYSQAEQLFQVHGQHGIDPTEPPASSAYPHPPVSHEPRIAELFDDLRGAGHHPFPLPVGILLDEQRPETSRCIRCGTCDGFPCLVHAKADAEVICVQPALAHSNVSLLTHAHVEKLETSASGREIRRVWVRRDGTDGALESFSADVVVVSAGAINSAALLLRSANERHPAGLANGSGVVGRHYMAHNNSAMLAISREPNPTIFQKTIGLNDFYHRADDFDFPLGHIQMLGKSDHDMLRGDAPIFAPEMALDLMATHALDFWMTSEDLPDPDNRVTLDPQGRIQLSYEENNLEGHRRLTAKLKGLLKTLGCQDDHLHARSVYLGKKIPLAGTAHQCGTVRFGKDPRTSALDIHCKAHELDNLYVVDGSFFVSSTAVNPGLTIMANALRVADHLRERLR
jgi:choline dehydrogenase-like flavoprotein